MVDPTLKFFGLTRPIGPPSQGRDPHDTLTLELPLEPDERAVDDRVLELHRIASQTLDVAAQKPGDFIECAMVALDLGYGYLCWLYLMERAANE
jgi:hypothetical protein